MYVPSTSFARRVVRLIGAGALSLLIGLLPVAEAFAARKGGNDGGGREGNSDRNNGNRGDNGGKNGASKPTRDRPGKDRPSKPPKDQPPKPPKDKPPKPPKERPPKPPKERPPKPPKDRPPKPPKDDGVGGRSTQFPSRPQPSQPRPGVPRPPVIAEPPRGPVFVPPLPRPASPPVTAFVPPPRIDVGPPQGRLPPRRRELPPRRVQSTVPPPNDVSRKRDQEILIAMDDSVSDGDSIVIGQGFALNVEVQYRSVLLGAKLVRLRIPDNRQAAQVIAQIAQTGLTDPRIIAVQPNYVFETTQSSGMTATPASHATLPQYATEKVRLSAAHQVALGRDVRVAVIDTGLDASHPELAQAVSESYDAIGEGKPEPEAHGTAVAGIVAARQQIRGMAPDARVLAVRAFAGGDKRKPEATTLSLIKGLDWAALNNARVVNMSFAGPKDRMLQEAIEEAEARGLIMVAAAGNGGPKAASAYPAAYERVIAVTASDSDDQVYEKANRGSYVAIAAPGVDILAPAPQAAYDVSSGTSMAAAHVSGIIALMLERNPALTTEQIRDILARTARDPDRSASKRGLGAGIIDAARAVAEVK